MGTFDTYSDVVACPTCRDVHWISGQTKFFLPFGSSNWFRPGVACPVDLDIADLAGPVWDSWWRLRDPIGGPERFTLLADFDDLIRCACGTWLASVMEFELAVTPGPPPVTTATMTRLELRDAATEFLDAIDFVDGEALWTGDHARFADALKAAAAAPLSDRHAMVRLWLRPPDVEGEDLTPTSWTTVVGPTQCEACGDVRERQEHTSLTHPASPIGFLAPAWTSGVIYLGGRVPFDASWLDEDIDRGMYLRARHPVASSTLTILGQRRSYGCACGAGRSSVVQRYVRHPGELELVELALRVVRDARDLSDIDFVEGVTRRWPTRPDLPPRSRETVLAELVAGFQY